MHEDPPCVLLVGLIVPAAAIGQEQRWVADASVGYAGFVDDATKEYALVGGALRRYVSTRVSIGPELVIMLGGDLVRDRAMLLTGNVIVDFGISDPALARMTPFLVGGVGTFWGRDIVRGGPYWSSDPAFTAGGGVCVRMASRVAAAAEYRIGWELHQRLSTAFRNYDDVFSITRPAAAPRGRVG